MFEFQCQLANYDRTICLKIFNYLNSRIYGIYGPYLVKNKERLAGALTKKMSNLLGFRTIMKNDKIINDTNLKIVEAITKMEKEKK